VEELEAETGVPIYCICGVGLHLLGLELDRRPTNRELATNREFAINTGVPVTQLCRKHGFCCRSVGHGLANISTLRLSVVDDLIKGISSIKVESSCSGNPTENVQWKDLLGDFGKRALPRSVNNRPALPIRPDVVAMASGRPLFLEVTVTHGVSRDKLEHIKALGASAIEFDLRNFPRQVDNTVLRELLLCPSTHKKWLFNARAIQLEAQLQEEVQKEIGRLEAKDASLNPTSGATPRRATRILIGRRTGRKYWRNYLEGCISQAKRSAFRCRKVATSFFTPVQTDSFCST
jgi:hypothetical protein